MVEPTENDLILFAQDFFEHLNRNLQKNICICLTKNSQGSHAYFPALMACFGFLEMLAGVFYGSTNIKKEQLFMFADKYFPYDVYQQDVLSILYNGTRHKVAHQSHPLFVNRYSNQISFSFHVTASYNKPAISLIKYKKKRFLKNENGRLRPPWPVWFTHTLKIHLGSFKNDLLNTSKKLEKDILQNSELLNNFHMCMKEYFPS